jgi:hypothetical protein
VERIAGGDAGVGRGVDVGEALLGEDREDAAGGVLRDAVAVDVEGVDIRLVGAARDGEVLDDVLAVVGERGGVRLGGVDRRLGAVRCGDRGVGRGVRSVGAGVGGVAGRRGGVVVMDIVAAGGEG